MTAATVGGYKHGTHSAYVGLKCRCEPCAAATRAYFRDRRARLLAERVLVGDDLVTDRPVTHGTVQVYNHYGCRCEPCRSAASTYHQRRAALRATR